jgi:hypothetical protein
MNPTDFIIAKYKSGNFTEISIMDVRSSFSNKEVHLRNTECMTVMVSHNEKDIKSVVRSFSTVGVYGQPFPLLLDCVKKAAKCLLDKREVLYVNILADHEGLLGEFLSIGYPDKMRKLRFFTNFLKFQNTIDKVMEYKEVTFQVDMNLSESTYKPAKKTDVVEFTERIAGDIYNLTVKGNTFKFSVNNESFVAIGTDNCVIDYKPKNPEFYKYLMIWNEFSNKHGLDLFLSIKEDEEEETAETKGGKCKGMIMCLAPPNKESESEFRRFYSTFVIMSKYKLLDGEPHNCLWALIILESFFPDIERKDLAREKIKKFFDSCKEFQLAETDEGYFFKWLGKNKKLNKGSLMRAIQKYADKNNLTPEKGFWKQVTQALNRADKKKKLLISKDSSLLGKNQNWQFSWNTNMLL